MKKTTRCERPFNGHGCGACLPCRLKKRREWTHRIMLEADLHADNAFLTLTYRDGPFSLEPLDHRRFMDALRKRLKPLRVRFYAVGEYGEKHGRPHYHYALFGYPSCKRGSVSARARGKYRCCAPCDILEEVWGRGFIYNKPLEMGSARYIARYVIKKMTRFDDPRLGNRHPEFARMSLKPGIGAGVVEAVASVITRYNLLTPEGDVPVTLRHGDLEWPLGRYLRRRLRIHLGLDERAPHVISAEASYKNFHDPENGMRILLEAARSDPENPSLKSQLLKASEGDRERMKRRHKLFEDKKGTL